MAVAIFSAPLYNLTMLSYLHAYHAGNHADILKHIVLSEVIRYMEKKDKPFTFFDTHSGSGLYKVEDERAQKTGEINSGILKLSEADLSVMEDLPAVKDYLSYVNEYLKKGEYPGSPYIEADLLRKDDSLMLSELHPAESENLKSNMHRKSREKEGCCHIGVHKRNGFEMLESMTPPVTKRGAVLIDPSYEETSDYSDVADAVLRAFKKWNGGVFMVWYPLLSYRMSTIENMVERITEGVHLISPNTDVNDFRLCVSDADSHEETSLSETSTPRLYGSGMLVVNTPWTLPDTMKKALPVLEELLKVS